MNAKLTKSERTRQYIIAQTATVFNEKGFAGTSLHDLTEATGLSKGSIYGNFRNKDEVALAAFDYNFQRVTDLIKGKILMRENSVDRLLVYPETYRDFMKIPFLQSGCPILNTATEADDTHPELRQRAIEAISFWKQSIENHVKRGIQRKEINAATDPTETAVVIISLIEGAIMQAKLSGKSTELHISMRFLEKMIINLKV